MMPHIVKLTKDDYDELLDTLNNAFSKDPQHSFDTILPAMWRRTDQAMGKHLAIRDGDTIASVVGIYPLEVTIGDEKLTFATVGNMGTRSQYRGKGYMRALYTEAMEELKRQHIHVARLGGQRQRYNRYGFEIAARQINFWLTPKNIPEGHQTRLHFVPIPRGDQKSLDFAQRLHSQNYMHVSRGDNDSFYDIMTAWNMIPYLALDETDTPVGYLAASDDHSKVAEQNAISPAMQVQLLLDWMTTQQVGGISVTTTPWNKELNRTLSSFASSWSLSSPTMLKIRDWLTLSKALLKAQKKVINIPHGKLTLHITGYGTLAFTDDQVAMTDEPPMITLNDLDATRFLCGFLPVDSVCDIPSQCQDYVRTLFPLPLGWNNQDRV